MTDSIRISTERPVNWLQPVFELLDRHKHTYLQPGETLDLEWVKHLVTNEPVWTLHQANQLIGVIWWENLQPGVGATIHLAVEPIAVRAFIRQRVGPQLLQLAQSTWQLRYVEAEFNVYRTQPVKWLKRFGFKQLHKKEGRLSVWHYTF